MKTFKAATTSFLPYSCCSLSLQLSLSLSLSALLSQSTFFIFSIRTSPTTALSNSMLLWSYCWLCLSVFIYLGFAICISLSVYLSTLSYLSDVLDLSINLSYSVHLSSLCSLYFYLCLSSYTKPSIFLSVCMCLTLSICLFKIFFLSQTIYLFTFQKILTSGTNLTDIFKSTYSVV